MSGRVRWDNVRHGCEDFSVLAIGNYAITVGHVSLIWSVDWNGQALADGAANTLISAKRAALKAAKKLTRKTK